MKKNKILISICLVLSMLISLTACSNSEDFSSNNTIVKMEDGSYVMNIDFDCEAPVYDAGTTRAVTYSWGKGATIFARLKSGSSYLKAELVNTSGSDWYLRWWGELAKTTTPVSCELYYLQESNGDYYVANEDTKCLDVYNNGTLVRTTTIPWNTETIEMSETTAVYGTTEATYTYPGDYFTMQATLKPLMWRLRFSGTNGTSITMPGNDNDITFCNKFIWKKDQALSCSKSTKDVTLKVSSSYTPYIYGEFVNSSSTNTITVVNGSNTFYREFSSSNLPAGKSGYFTIPTTSNYSNNGWTMKQDIDPNATIQPDNLVTFTDGVVMEWKLGSTVNTFDFNVFTKSYAEGLTDNQLESIIYGSTPFTIEDADYTFKSTDSEWFKANTEYYLCAVAKNSSGVRGPVLRQLFKTNSNNLPSAEISNIKAASTTKWNYNITLKNNAKSYYLATSFNESNYKKDWHWFAYYVYWQGATGQLEAHDWTSVATTLNSGTCNLITVCTWGLDANKNIGNPNVAYGSVSSSSRSLSPVNPSLKKDMISHEQMQKIRNNTVVYMINE